MNELRGFLKRPDVYRALLDCGAASQTDSVLPLVLQVGDDVRVPPISISSLLFNGVRPNQTRCELAQAVKINSEVLFYGV